MGIEVRNLCKKFTATGPGKQPVVAADDVTFEVCAGSLTALLGPSGSGKSTILRMIAGLEIPDRGEVILHGEGMTGADTRQRGVGFVFQHYALFKHMSVRNNISFGLRVRKQSRSEISKRVDELLNLVQLEGYEDRYPSQLSGGQQQRVALARALAPKPKFLLLDEPFGALDAKVRRNLATQLRQLHDEVQTTSVFVTHDQEEAIEIADQIVVINHGRVEQAGTAEEVYDHPASKFVASFIGNVNVVEAVAEEGAIRPVNGTIVIPQLDSPVQYGEVVLLIRPEDIELETSGSRGCLTGTVSSVRYRGDRYEIDLQVNGMNLHMVEHKSRGKAPELAEGREICVRFNRCLIFSVEQGHDTLREQLRSLGYIE